MFLFYSNYMFFLCAVASSKHATFYTQNQCKVLCYKVWETSNGSRGFSMDEKTIILSINNVDYMFFLNMCIIHNYCVTFLQNTGWYDILRRRRSQWSNISGTFPWDSLILKAGFLMIADDRRIFITDWLFTVYFAVNFQTKAEKPLCTFKVIT